jgi:hypothetical protein
MLQTATKAKTQGSKVKPPKRKAPGRGEAPLPQLSESDEGGKDINAQAEEGAIASASAAHFSCSTEPGRCGRGNSKKARPCDLFAFGERVGCITSALRFRGVLAVECDGR